MATDSVARGVFINCPFDDEFRPLFYAIVFTLHDCGFEARCSLERGDSGELRMQKKIYSIIHECDLAIHDLSRRGLDEGSNLPRFNMPMELGVWLGAKRFGGDRHARKTCLILADERYLYQQYLSDIAGQDIQSHRNNVRGIIGAVRRWVSQFSKEGVILPSPQAISSRFETIIDFFDEALIQLAFGPADLPFPDFITLLTNWLKRHPR